MGLKDMMDKAKSSLDQLDGKLGAKTSDLKTKVGIKEKDKDARKPENYTGQNAIISLRRLTMEQRRSENPIYIGLDPNDFHASSAMFKKTINYANINPNTGRATIQTRTNPAQHQMNKQLHGELADQILDIIMDAEDNGVYLEKVIWTMDNESLNKDVYHILNTNGYGHLRDFEEKLGKMLDGTPLGAAIQIKRAIQKKDK